MASNFYVEQMGYSLFSVRKNVKKKASFAIGYLQCHRETMVILQMHLKHARNVV